MPETEAAPTRRGLSISVPQLAASVLASVSAAFLASFFGVAGTLIGTALGSLVATLATALYLHSITRTTSYLKARSGPPRPAGTGKARPVASRSPDKGAPQSSPARVLSARGRHLGWKGALLAAVVVFFVTIGVVTVIEKAASAPLSHLVGGTGTSGAGTTVGHLFSGGSSPQKGSGSTSSTTTSTTAPSSQNGTTTTTTPTSSSTTAPASTTTTTPSASPTTTAPSATPTSSSP